MNIQKVESIGAVREAIEQTGSIYQAARLLGVHGNTIRDWLHRYGLRVKKTAAVVSADEPTTTGVAEGR